MRSSTCPSAERIRAGVRLPFSRRVPIGDITDFAKRLHQIIGGLAVVFDDQEAHIGVGCGQGSKLSITMARAAPSCKATTRFPVNEKRAVKLGDFTALRPSDGGGRIPPEGSQRERA